MNLHRIASAFLLVAGLQAQDAPKVAAPLPPVDLDHKIAAPGAPSAPTPPKSDAPAPAPQRTHAAPPKTAERATLPSGRTFAPRMPTEPVFGSQGGGIDVLGTTYKARVADGAFTYVPYFGAEAPRNYPLELRLAGVRIGNTATPLQVAPHRRDGQRITLAHGSCEEVFDIGRDGVEQKFVIATPFQGELTITLQVRTDLRAERAPSGWRFTSAHGSVGYSDAVLVDARGTRLPMRTEFAAGALTLHAAASAIASAAFPITVDPLITTFNGTSDATYVLIDPDIAYSATAQSHLVVWTRRYSATDYDLHGLAVDDNGTVLGNSFTMFDNSGDKWEQGRVAVCGGNYLAVASRTPAAGGQREIWGATRAVSSATVGAQFQISDNAMGNKVAPDVGGEFWGPANFCVVWQRNFSATDRDIHYRMVSSSGTLNGAVAIIDNSSGNDDYQPSIARCDGDGPSSMQFWPVTWQRLVNGQYDILGARVRWDGQLTTAPFVIDNAVPDDDQQPCPSSLTSDLGGVRYWLVAYTTLATGNWDVFVRVYADGTTPVLRSSSFLGSLENLTGAPRTLAQWTPEVDTDGCRFAISYLEDYSPTDYDAYLTTVHLASSLAAIDARVPLTTSTRSTNATSLFAKRSGGGESLDYAAAYDHNSNSGPINSSIEGAFYRGVRASGGFATRATGCGGMAISYANGSQVPGPGRTVRIDVSGGLGNGLIVFGLPTDQALCASSPCRLGATTMVLLPVTSLAFTIPCQASVVGATVALQGVGIVGSGGCVNLGQVATTDTVDITVR